MDATYFNFRETEVQGRWDRRAFFKVWWRFYEGDPWWTPPYYPTLRRALTPPYAPYLQRRDPRLLFLEAVRRPPGAQTPGHPLPVSAWERPVAATVTLPATGGVVRLALPRCANDKATLRQLLERAAAIAGGHTLLGPTHLSPYLGAGALDSHWNLRPPQYTPYNPPYFPDLLRSVMEPATRSRLYHLEVPPHTQSDETGPASLVPLEPHRLAGDLLPLLAAACDPWPDFAPPGPAAAGFILRWLEQWPLHAWLAVMDGQPAGFVLLQLDRAAAMQRAGGGKALWWRLWLRWSFSRGAAAGRLLFGAVLPAWRDRGVGAQLLAAAQASAVKAGWQKLTIGPIPEGAPAGGFLEKFGARPQQGYQLYRWQAPSRRRW